MTQTSTETRTQTPTQTHTRAAGRRPLFAAAMVAAFAFAFALALAPASAPAQGFMVKPMKIELSPRPGQTMRTPLSLRSTLQTPQTVDLQVLDLGQGGGGSYALITPTDTEGSATASAASAAPEHSCRAWTSLSASSLLVPPMQEAEVMIEWRVPPGARGAYAAAIIAQTRPPEGAAGVGISIRFLIPLILEIQGPPQRQQIALTDAALALRDGSEGQPADTVGAVVLENRGRTHSRVKAELTVMGRQGERWQRVATVGYREFGFLPGQRVEMTEALPRRLPSGDYRLVAALTVDGRRERPLEKEIAFVGDPTAGAELVGEVDLALEPGRVEVEGIPGARRSAFVTLRNPSEESLRVACIVEQPEALKGVAMGETLGDHFSGHEWADISPAQFVMAPRSERRLAVRFEYPAEGLDQGAFYSRLRVLAAYSDGQMAGELGAMLVAKNQRAEAEPKMVGVRLAVTGRDEGVYSVLATFANVGGVHVDPRAVAQVYSGTAALAPTRTVPMERGEEAGVVLPLSQPRFTGELDVRNLEPGAYLLRVICTYGSAEGQSVDQQIGFRVTEPAEGKREVELIEG